MEGFPGGSVVKNSPANAGDSSLIPGSGRSSGVGNGNPLEYARLRKSHEQRRLAGYSPGGRKRVGHNLVTKQQIEWNLPSPFTLFPFSRHLLHQWFPRAIMPPTMKLEQPRMVLHFQPKLITEVWKYTFFTPILQYKHDQPQQLHT